MNMLCVLYKKFWNFISSVIRHDRFEYILKMYREVTRYLQQIYVYLLEKWVSSLYM